VQITKKLFLCNPELPKDLSISNAVTVNRCSTTYPWRPNAGITPLHRRWWWSQCSRPQGHCRTWCKVSGATQTSPPRTCTCTMITMTPGISDLAEIAKVDGFWPNPGTPQHGGVQRWCDLNPTQPFGRSRWRERGGGGEYGAQGGEGSSRLVLLCHEHLSLGPPLYSGEGVHLAPPPRHLGKRPRERRPRAAAGRVQRAAPT
jgi:hypothetical protein